MWIVRLALRRPYTIAVMAILILVLGVLSLSRMVVDIFPAINLPVVAVVWSYPGLSAEDMERRVVIISERAYSSSVNGIERIESRSLPGLGILRVYFHPGADLGAAIAQMSSVSSTILRITPPGMTPPNVIQFNASNVPVAQLTVSSKTLPEQQLFDYGLNFIRIRLFTIPGLSTPAPFGGKARQINVDVDPQALAARGLSPADVVSALQAANLILPAGSARMHNTEYLVTLNSSPRKVSEFNDLPVKTVGSATVRLGDVARVSDSFADQTNLVRVDGKRATYLAILKHADASTLAVVESVKNVLPVIKATAPKGMELRVDFDQSVFVRAAINGVLREAVLSSVLVSVMILMFLGSWRSMVIVCTSIPLAIFSAIIGLKLTGHTINIMTLGGLALAIGMLVDDATVEVENIHRNRMMRKPLTVAILDGAQQIAVPAIVATLAICIVFFPVVLLVGPARFLFTPLALGVVLAMLASYLLSRTLVPTLSRMLMASEKLHIPERDAAGAGGGHDEPHEEHGYLFGLFLASYSRILELCLQHRAFTVLAAVLFGGLSMGLALVVGTDFFPQVDAGLMKLHFRAPVGSRIEETERLVADVERGIREIIPPAELETINSMVGVPISYNFAFVPTDNSSSMDAEILVALKHPHKPTVGYQASIRQLIGRRFPGSSAYFQSADIVGQVLNFGLSAPLTVQVEGNDLHYSYGLARRLRDDIRSIPGTADVHIVQTLDYPRLHVEVDRVRAAQLGLTQRDVAQSMLIALSTSALISPSYFLNPINSVNYIVAVRVPLNRVTSQPELMATPVSPPSPGSGAGVTDSSITLSSAAPGATLSATADSSFPPRAPTQILSNVASVSRTTSPNEIRHYTVQRVIELSMNVEGRDLGSVTADIERRIARLGALRPGSRITVRGQNEVMLSSFRSLGLGLVLAILLVYLLMVVLFQSWLDPFIIMVAVPGALVGILWMLTITGSTINVESLMGSIMAVGIAVSNSILLVSFANDLRVEHPEVTALEAALRAGRTRLRPVIMTALAMIIGMVPMALGLGEAGEQNAPLGRAVIGGLGVATFVTLLLVPVVYSILRRGLPTKHLLEERFLAEERGETP
jgi:multidrug efflux pump subunit AcrB